MDDEKENALTRLLLDIETDAIASEGREEYDALPEDEKRRMAEEAHEKAKALMNEHGFDIT